MFLLARLARRLIRVGTLIVVDARGRTHVFTGAPGPTVTVRLHRRGLDRHIFFDPSMATGEAFMEGTLTVENGSIYELLDLAARNMVATPLHPLRRAVLWLRRLLRSFHQYNPAGQARRHAAHHYDLTGRLYELFLDTDRQYSCGYFLRPEDDLETAQRNKKHHIAAKLLLSPGHRVLDIGSGWGGLALYLARELDVEVTGITLSTEQMAVARERARTAGLEGRARFHLCDYRDQVGTFDRIVSVGMFEHVGVPHYDQFFRKMYQLLSEDGVALLHTIGRAEGPGATDPWIRKYIFPGGYIPALSEVTRAIEKAGLWITDIEVWRLHYAETLRHWRRRFVANWDAAAQLYDERFCRMWEYYLAASEVSFRHLDNVVFQIQIARRRDAVPLTRDYVIAWERERIEADRGRRRLRSA